MHAYTYIRCMINGYDAQKSEEMPTALIKNMRELRSDTMTVITFKEFGASKVYKGKKKLSEAIPQSVCAHVPLFQVYKQPNWGPVRRQAMVSHTYICTCVCGGRRVMNLLHAFHESS